MTLPLGNRMDYTGNGAVSTYSYTYRIDADADLAVTVRDTDGAETALVLTTDYTVTGAGATSGGTIVLVNNSQAWLTAGKLTTDYHLTILRIVDLTQDTDLPNQGAYLPETLEDQLDRQVMISQQQQDEIDRSVKLPETVAAAGFDMTLPADIASNPSSYLAVNADGDGLMLVAAAADSGLVSAYGATLIDDADAAAARTTLGFAGTGGKVQEANIEALTITAASLASNAVTTAKITNANVTAAKLAEAVYDILDVYAGTSTTGNDTYVVTPSPAFTSYVTGMKLSFKPDTANTGAATLNVNGLGAKDIKAFVNGAVAALQDNVIPASSMVTVQYDGTQFILLSSGVATGTRLVSVSSLSAASSLAITGLTAGTRYRLDFSIIQNTADGNTRLGFNADTNARYAWTNRETISSATGQNGATGDTYCYLSLSGSKTAEPILGHIEFCTVPGTASKATYRSTLSCIKAGTTVPAISESGGVYTGVADVTQVNLSPSAGTLTGTVLLYALGA